MFKNRIVFRADGNTDIGLGHLVRCLALLEYMQTFYECIFCIKNPSTEIETMIFSSGGNVVSLLEISQNDELQFLLNNLLVENDIVILDGYTFNSEYQKKIKNKVSLLITIDDLNAFTPIADILINTSGNAFKQDYDLKNGTNAYLGLDYVLLRKEFFKNTYSEEICTKSNIQNIVICFGGGDKFDLTNKFSQALIELNRFKKITIVVGGAYLHKELLLKNISALSNTNISVVENINANQMFEIMHESDLVICSASGILSECYAVGVGILCGYYVENQIDIYNFAVENSLVFPLGNLLEISKEGFLSFLNNITLSQINAQLFKQKRIVDGKSLQRIERIITTKYFEKKLSFRTATSADCLIYYDWVNEHEVRLNSFNSLPIDLNAHIKWFDKKINNKDSYLYLFEINKICVAQVRFDYLDNYYYIDFSIESIFRGKGFGEIVLKRAITELVCQVKHDLVLKAEVKYTNIPSQKTFLKLDFEINSLKNVNECLEFTKKCTYINE